MTKAGIVRPLIGLVSLSVALYSLASASDVFAQGGIPDPDGFSRYWAGSCIEATHRSDDFYWRARQDSFKYTARSDTALEGARQFARLCLDEIDTSSLDARDYLPLAGLYFLLDDDESARKILDRRLALPDVQSAEPRSWLLARIVNLALGASPARATIARSYIAQFDSLDRQSAGSNMILAYSALLGYYRGVWDEPNMTGIAERMISIGKELTNQDREVYGVVLFSAYRTLAEIAGAKTGDSILPKAVLSRAAREIGRLRDVERSLRYALTIFRAYGTRAEEIDADYWGRKSVEGPLPSPGKVTVVAFNLSRQTVPVFRRIQENFSDRVDVVAVTSTRGYFRSVGPLSPEREVELLSRHFIEELGFSGNWAIDETEFMRFPDGRREPQETANEAAYRARFGARVIIVDGEGVIRRILTSWDRFSENRIEEAILQWSSAREIEEE